MTITVNFNPPTPADSPAVFDQKAFATLGDLNTWSSQANSLKNDVNSAASGITTAANTATTKADEAHTSALNAANSASSALASLNDFRGRWYGPLASNPTLDPLGAAINAGDAYWNTTASELRIYSGTVWNAPATQAAASALSASDSASSASTSASTATTKANEASASADDADDAALLASTSATNASNSANAANASAVSAASSLTGANTAATLAQDWSTKTNGEVVTGQGFGAKKYAQDAASAADSASSAASTATTKASEAAISAQAAADAVASISGGPVASVNGQTGVVTLTKSSLGLGNVDNTSDANKPVSAATQTALDSKQATLVSGTNIKTVGGQDLLGSGNVAVGDVTGQASSVDNELALFSGTGGKTIKRATTTGMLKATSGVIAAATAGTDFVAPGTATTFTAVQNFTADGMTLKGSSTGISTFTSANTSATNYTVTVPSETFEVGFRNIPQNIQDTTYALVLADSGKHIYKSSTTARTWTIPANSSVAFPIGTAITFVNGGSSGNCTIAITSDTMRLAGAGTTGSRTLGIYGIATAVKVAATVWVISGTGLT
jgi:hypothetical protein